MSAHEPWPRIERTSQWYGLPVYESVRARARHDARVSPALWTDEIRAHVEWATELARVMP